MKQLIIFLLCLGSLTSCEQEYIPRTPPFEFEVTDSTITVFEPEEGGILYYAPEAYPTGWGRYDWDPYNLGAWCPTPTDPRRRIVIVLDERYYILLWTRTYEYFTTVKELKALNN